MEGEKGDNEDVRFAFYGMQNESGGVHTTRARTRKIRKFPIPAQCVQISGQVAVLSTCLGKTIVRMSISALAYTLAAVVMNDALRDGQA